MAVSPNARFEGLYLFACTYAGITGTLAFAHLTGECLGKGPASFCSDLAPSSIRFFSGISWSGASPCPRARVSLTLRLICGYLLRSLLPFLTCIYDTLLDLEIYKMRVTPDATAGFGRRVP